MDHCWVWTFLRLFATFTVKKTQKFAFACYERIFEVFRLGSVQSRFLKF